MDGVVPSWAVLNHRNSAAGRFGCRDSTLAELWKNHTKTPAAATPSITTMHKPPCNKLDPRFPGETWSSFFKRWGDDLRAWCWIGPLNVRLAFAAVMWHAVISA